MGFREASDASRETAAQDGFNAGFRGGFAEGVAAGRVMGVARCAAAPRGRMGPMLWDLFVGSGTRAPCGGADHGAAVRLWLRRVASQHHGLPPPAALCWPSQAPALRLTG